MAQWPDDPRLLARISGVARSIEAERRDDYFAGVRHALSADNRPGHRPDAAEVEAAIDAGLVAAQRVAPVIPLRFREIDPTRPPAADTSARHHATAFAAQLTRRRRGL